MIDYHFINLIADLPAPQALAVQWAQFFKDAMDWGIEAGKRALLFSASMYLIKYMFTN